MRLSPQTAARLPPEVRGPGYDRAAQARGIVHLGLGAFHRAHQAVYTDDAMAAGDRDWAITGVSLRSPNVRDALAPQGGLYTVAERDGPDERLRLIGSVAEALVAPEAPEAVIAALADPGVRIVSLTVTEKAYFIGGDGALDGSSAALAADLAGEGPPRTLYGLLAAGLARRRGQGAPGLTLLSCDNLAGNGTRLGALLAEFVERRDPSLAPWLRHECASPCTMVDRIVPATRADDLDRIEARLGLRDEAAVVAEPFRQWVIEDRFAGARPRWEGGGAQVVADVAAYEAAKLRLLNGAHSALAYAGLRRGHVFVHEAIADAEIRALVQRLMREAAESLPTTAGLDLPAYAKALMARFANAGTRHRLAQIAMDGSQKIPQRWLPALKARQAQGQASPAILEALAAWLLHLRGDNGPVEDPLAGELAAVWASAGQHGIAAALFGPGGRFADQWEAGPDDLAALGRAIDRPRIDQSTAAAARSSPARAANRGG